MRRCRDSEERLDIKVGSEDDAKRWKVHKRLICRYSGYFKTACNSQFSEALTGGFDMSDDDPDAFALFVDWLYSRSKEPPT
jgi:hypothetical protein